MKTMKWLVQREFWEHKGSMFWAPIVVGGLMVLFISCTIMFVVSRGSFRGNVEVNGRDTSIGAIFSAIPAEKQQAVVEMVSSVYMVAAAPLFLMLAAIAFFYCLGALYDERRDRSILFWKSLPVSDAQTVLSKVIMASVVAPVITIAVGLATSLLLLLVVGITLAFYGINMFGMVLSNPNFYMAPFQVLGLLPVYLLWALPTIGWLLMVSAWARSKVFLWAVGAPVLAAAVIKWVDYILGVGMDMKWVFGNVIARGLFGLVPGNWLPFAKVNPAVMVEGVHRTVSLGDVFTQSWMTLATPQAWIGALAGAAMIFAAMRLRRWKDEG